MENVSERQHMENVSERQHSAEERDVVTAHSLDRASQAAHSSQRA